MRKHFNALPGFGLTMGFTLFYLSVIVLFPIGGLLLKVAGVGWEEFWRSATTERALAAYQLTFGASLVAALINAVFGTVLAWVLVRYHFPGKRLVDALVDIPFALPTAVAGLTLASLFAPNGWLGKTLVPMGIEGAYTRLGIVIALTFVSMPFVVRTLQPVIESLEREVEEAAATLGAGRFKTFINVIAPTLLPTLITGFALSFARSVGEYGSVVFISSNIPYQTEIAPLVIITALESYEYNAAMSVAVVLLAVSFAMLVLINLLEKWARKSPVVMAAVITKRKGNTAKSQRGSEESRLAKWTLITIALLFVMVFLLLPLINVFYQAFSKGWALYKESLLDPNTIAAIKLTLFLAAISVPLNLLFGLAASWAIAKFEFRGKAFLITLIDLPFAVSPVVAGLMFVVLFGREGFFGEWLDARDIKIIFAWPGMMLATVFITFPFVARELIPVMQATGSEQEQAALTLGASGWKTFFFVTLPSVKWGLIYGVILCNARAMGEFGAVSVVSGHIEGITDTLPLRVDKLFHGASENSAVAAFVVASILGVLALITLVLKTVLEWKQEREYARAQQAVPDDEGDYRASSDTVILAKSLQQ